ncbi:MAG: Holliday junction branch migration protein RuvA [Spirochaetales bacterium]|nr:Holliday junction branch migration protein RuvA [Spirochaetales bacterium]
MFHSIKGKLTEKREDGMCILTGGIEWDITVSRNTSIQLPETGNDCRIFVYLYHREDKLALFGFHTIQEKRLFLNLLKVEGIGPSLGIKILSGITPAQFIKALEIQDMEVLTGIPGLGKKTAQKIILTLAGKLSMEESGNKVHADIIKALTGMGFDAQQARKAVTAAASEIDEASLNKEEYEKKLLKAALTRLGKS